MSGKFERKDVYDVIITGAGPSGSVCACFLAKNGFKVLLLEKFSFPRQKLCAGGVPSSVFDIIPIPDSDNMFIPLQNYVFTFRGEKETRGRIKGGSIRSVDRSIFDMKLAHSARDAGAELKENSPVADAVENDNTISVICDDGRSYTGKILVGADGGHSRIAGKFFPHFIKMKKEETGICGFYKFYTNTDVMNRYRDTVHLDFNFINKGVAGILPKKDHLWIGVYKSEKDVLSTLKKAADEFLYLLGLKGDREEFRGLLIPLYTKKRNLVKNRVLLAGEAAKLVNPLSGEGIKPAMDSGRIAAEEITKYLRDEKPLSEYSDRIHEEIGKELLIAGQFLKIAYMVPGIAYDGMTHVADDAVRILNGDLSYGNFMERLKKKILRKVGFK